MRSGLTCVAATALLVACSPQRTEPQAPSAEAPPPTASTAAGPTALGAGTALNGSVSGLTGLVQPFRVQETATSTIVELAADVLFAFDKADLAPAAAEQLRRTADLITRGGQGDIAVIGHTDSKGDDAYNLDLSRRRAQAVAAWLSGTGGVDANRLKPVGKGEAEPVAPNATASGADDPDGRARNRRVVIVIPKG